MKPHFEISKEKVLSQFDLVKEACDLVSYSSKTNQEVTKILEEERDCWFSVHFENELRHNKDYSRVLFLAQAWKKEDINRLVDLGINKFVVDNEKDLDELLSFLKENNNTIELFLRMRLKENTIRTEKYYVFGMYSETINKRVPELKKNPKIEKLGVHFHRKTQNMAEWNLKYEISSVLNDEVLQSIDYMNVGGGLPAEYANTDMRVLESVFNRIREFKGWLNSLGIKIIIEPGRFIAAPAGKLVTHVIGVYDNNIVVDASVYNTNMDALIVGVKLLIEGEVGRKEGEAYSVKGCTPCSMDLFRYRVYLKNVKVDDELVFLNAGAYNFTTDFCDLKKLETKVLKSHNPQIKNPIAVRSGVYLTLDFWS